MIILQQGTSYFESNMTVDEFHESNLYKTKGCILYCVLDDNGNSITDGKPWPLSQPEPQTVIPTFVTIRQACRQLEVLGLLDEVELAVSNMNRAAQIDWQKATTVDRDYPFTQQMIAMLGWTEEEADTYFIEAAKL